MRICKYFVCFFVSFALFFANLAIRSPQGSKRLRNARTFVQAKHLDHINKSTFYIRLTALRRSGYSFPPTLRFATHWAELTHPSELLQWSQLSVFKQSAIIQQSNNSTNSTIKQLNARRASLFTFSFSLFSFFDQLLRMRLSVFDDAHEVQSCRQSGHQDLERRLIRPERADSLVCIP